MKRSVSCLAISAVLLFGPRWANAFNVVKDIRENVKWEFGQAAQAGQGYDFSSKKWDVSALAEIAEYRFLSASYGATFLDANSSKATDTFKVGILSNFFFKLFTNPPTPQMQWMQNLNIGPSYAIPVFSGNTGHRGVLLLDISIDANHVCSTGRHGT
jgi:hypothetical protein